MIKNLSPVLDQFQKRGNSRSSYPRVFLGKGALEICSKFTGEHPCRSMISNSTSALVLSCKLAAYFQSTFFSEHLWTAASGIGTEL